MARFCREPADVDVMKPVDGRIPVYVVDDNEVVLALLVDLIDASDELAVVGFSTSAQDAVRDILRMRPVVAVVDGDIAGHDGLDVCRRVLVSAPTVACIIVTAGVGLGWDAAEAEEAGVSAVVLKQLVDFPLVKVIVEVAGDHGVEANR